MILHIPHSSTNLRKYKFNENVDIEHELNVMTDWFTNELFDHQYADRLVFNTSRLVCDVERYSDSTIEPMESWGHGMVYYKTSNGEPLRELYATEREDIYHKYYLPHHNKLDNIVEGQLGYYDKVVLVDCHSFGNTPLLHEVKGDRPNICLGVDDEKTPSDLVEMLVKYFTLVGYTVAINLPFEGTMVPTYHRKNPNFKAIMIEVNRDLYLDHDYTKSDNFDAVKNKIEGALDLISLYENL